MATKITGSFTGTGTSAEVKFIGAANLSLSGFGSATVKLQRRVDGQNWRDVYSFTSDAEEVVYNEGEHVAFRLNCSVFSSGPIVYWFGR